MNANSHLLMSLAVVIVAGLVIFGKKIWEKVSAPFQRFSRWMKDLTTDFSGEDSDQQVAAIGAAMLGDELRSDLDTPRTRSRGEMCSRRDWVAYKGHSGGMKCGRVVATRERGLHGQARVRHGHYSVWRDMSSLYKVSA